MAEMTVPLQSSNIAGVSDYDAEARSFAVFFRDGSEYSIAGVSRGVYEGLVESPSPGSFYHRNIRDQYRIEREG